MGCGVASVWAGLFQGFKSLTVSNINGAHRDRVQGGGCWNLLKENQKQSVLNRTVHSGIALRADESTSAQKGGVTGFPCDGL
jgi:hypothetical protein